MSRYKCQKCGQVFEEEEIVVDKWREYRGECHGVPAYETVSEEHCPFCRSEYFEEFTEVEE